MNTAMKLIAVNIYLPFLVIVTTKISTSLRFLGFPPPKKNYLCHKISGKEVQPQLIFFRSWISPCFFFGPNLVGETGILPRQVLVGITSDEGIFWLRSTLLFPTVGMEGSNSNNQKRSPKNYPALGTIVKHIFSQGRFFWVDDFPNFSCLTWDMWCDRSLEGYFKSRASERKTLAIPKTKPLVFPFRNALLTTLISGGGYVSGGRITTLKKETLTKVNDHLRYLSFHWQSAG